MKQLNLEVNGRVVKVWVHKEQGCLWAHFNGRTFLYEKEDNDIDMSSGAVSDGHIYAPMPGKIMKVNVNVGDVVNADQVLIVMEAMKMEYSLEAGVSGCVVKINYVEGDQVSAKDLLVKVEPPPQ